MPATARLYKLYDDDDQLVFVGTSAECRNKWYMKGGFHLGTYVRKLKFRKRYTVVPYGEELDECRVPKDRVIRIKKRYVEMPGDDERRLNYILEMLKKYGNTVSRKDPERYLGKIREAGFDVWVRKIVDRTDGAFWIIEVLW